MKELAVIILNYNTKNLTLDCIESVLESGLSANYFEVWLVDNNSSDGSVESVKKRFPLVKIIRNENNLGFSKGNNVALKKAKASSYLVLNSDTKILKGSLEHLINFMSQNDYGVATCHLLNPDQTFQPNGGSLPSFFPVIFWLSGIDDICFKLLKLSLPSFHCYQKAYYTNNRLDWVSGTAMVIKDTVLRKIGLLDSKIFMYAEDVDYCWRVKKAGYKIGFIEDAKIIHIGGGSSNRPMLNQWRGEFRGLIYLYKKYYGYWASLFLRLIIYISIIARVIGFSLFGKLKHAKTYAKILVSL